MKGRKGKANGGEMDSPKSGTKEYEQDLKRKNLRYTYQSNVNDAAEERKSGGRAKKAHAGRKARKAGGRAGSDKSPLSSAHAGAAPKGRKTLDID
jgi:hypothetical protein